MLSTMAVSAVAAEVNDDNVTTFEANTPAVAAQMNSTMNALITAINDNSARLTALEDAADAVTPSVSGRSFTFIELEVEVFGDSANDFTRNSLYRAQHSLVFGTDNTGTVTSDGFDIEVGHFPDLNGDGIGHSFLAEGDVAAGNFTWTQTGHDVTMMFPDIGDGPNSMDIRMSFDGSIGVKTEQNTFGDPNSNFFGGTADVGIAIRVE